jgi:hypothetical protein
MTVGVRQHALRGSYPTVAATGSATRAIVTRFECPTFVISAVMQCWRHVGPKEVHECVLSFT